MKTLTLALLLIFIISSVANADQDWFCKQESSEVTKDMVQVCGVAIGRTEGEARRVAFRAAHAEFSDLCSISEHCKNRKFDVIPARTECVTTPLGYKCYRMIKFVLSPEGT